MSPDQRVVAVAEVQMEVVGTAVQESNPRDGGSGGV